MKYSIPLEDCIRLAKREEDFENWMMRAKQDYTDLVFRWLAACRDYPYAQHARPTSAQLSDLFCNMVIEQCAREFVRSNTGFICPSH